MIKIGVLNKGLSLKWGHNFGYWFYLKYFYQELLENGYEIKFYNNLTQEFFKSDLIMINSRIYTDTKINLVKKLNLRSNHNFLDS